MSARLAPGDDDAAAIEPVEMLALIDTGASTSVIQAGLAARLDLTPIGVEYISTPSSASHRCLEYFVRLLLPNDVGFQLPVLEAPLEDQEIHCLIGRDVLAEAVLVYIGYDNQLTLSF